MNSYELEPGFLERLRNYYVTNGHLTSEQFDEAQTKAEAVLELKLLPGRYWGVTPQITSMYPKLLTSTKFKAQAAAFQVPFQTLEEYCRDNYPPVIMRKTHFLEKPNPKQKIGLVFNQLGLITKAQLAQALGVQQIIRDQADTSPRFGLVLMRVANISLPDLLQVVGFQVGIAYENMDQFVAAYEKQFNTSACP